jgi:hypothetical protein
MTKTPASNTGKELPGYPVQNSPSGNYSWEGDVGRVEIVYDIVWMGCLRRTPWTELRTPVCSYPIDVFHLSFNFLCLLLLYSIYLCALYSNTVLKWNTQPLKWKEQIRHFRKVSFVLFLFTLQENVWIWCWYSIFYFFGEQPVFLPNLNNDNNRTKGLKHFFSL